MSADVAVIIPAYNRASSLKRAIESVQAQTRKGWEIIVVDDGSEDDSEILVQGYANCRYMKIQHSGLPAVARNIGIRMTDASYVAFLDSDDEWFPRKLATQFRIIEATSSGLVCSNASLVCGDDRAGMRPYLPAEQKHAGRVLRNLLAENFVITSSVVVRREVLDRAGGFNENPLLRGLEDYDLWLRLAKDTDFYYVDEELLFYNRTNTSLSGSRSMLSQWQGMEFIFSRVDHAAAEKEEALRRLVNRQLAACRRSICNEYLALREYRAFARSFAKFCSKRPVAAAKYIAALMLKYPQ